MCTKQRWNSQDVALKYKSTIFQKKTTRKVFVFFFVFFWKTWKSKLESMHIYNRFLNHLWLFGWNILLNSDTSLILSHVVHFPPAFLLYPSDYNHTFKLQGSWPLRYDLDLTGISYLKGTLLRWAVSAPQINNLANNVQLYYRMTVGRTRVRVPGEGMQGIWLWLKEGQWSTALTLACCLRGWGALWRPVPVTVLNLPCSEFTQAEPRVEIWSKRIFFNLSAVSGKFIAFLWLASSLRILVVLFHFTARSEM